MIKILFFIDKFAYNGSIGGAEKVLITLVNHMDPDKFDITVQTLFPDGFSSLLNPNIKYMYCYPKKTSFTHNLFRIEAELGLTYPFHIKGDYDIEVAYLENEATKVIAASTNNKAKKIAWVHCDFGIAVKDKEDFIAKTAKRYKKYDKIVCVSEKCKESFISMFGNNPEVVVINNVIDNKEIMKKADQHLPIGVKKKKITLCTVGRFSPQKNYMRLLKTAYQLFAEGYDYDLWIIGDGQQRELIEDYINAHRMDSYVTLFGFQKNPYPYIEEADILVCSSNYEGFSTFITEGLILGKPIVTTDVSGMRELLGDSEYGLITANDDEDFYQGLKRMIDDDDLRAHYQRQAEMRGKSFSTDKLVKENETFLQKILS